MYLVRTGRCGHRPLHCFAEVCLLLQSLFHGHSHGNGSAAMGEQRAALRVKSRNLPVAGCHFAHGRRGSSSFLLLQCFLNSHSHGNGSADHGVVAHAQEAHHFYVKSALRRLCGDFSRAFGAVSPTFRKTRDTSKVSIGCAFLTETHLITSSVHETRSFD